LLTANGVYGFWPANSDGDDIVVQVQGSKFKVQSSEATLNMEPGTWNSFRFHTLRQQWDRQGQKDFRALADYVAPVESGRTDYLGAFAVTTGLGCDELCLRFHREHDDYNSIMAKALADRLAEAFAELLHEKARRDWGYGHGERLTGEELIAEKYRGIRPAPGYPSQPDHTEKRTLFDLLAAEESTGIRLTESYAMWPAASVCGLYFAHPQARYFAVDRITREQVEDYTRRKAMPLAQIERWLAPNLGYEP
jgi:5-methyltetrahydrofolate--homocysteine methyltransferase